MPITPSWTQNRYNHSAPKIHTHTHSPSKLPDENIKKILFTRILAMIFLDMTPKAQATK